MDSGATASNGAPQLQVDLVSLSNLVLNVGSRGLKQLATSGVDLHSLGCMLMIAELVPASRDFRVNLSRARQQQRSERFWFYKAVEIGAGSNFLVDQLLKTRAGENVLALMTAIAPITNETSCTVILSALFESAGVSLDNTPGIDEFRKVRAALLPLTRKSDLKEKVLQCQHLLQTFVHETQFQADRDPYDALPHDKDITTIIQMLFKVTSDKDYVFTYNGIQGAGWVATYSSYVLGLPVCAIKDSGQTLPISGIYEQARVVIRPMISDSGVIYNISKAGEIQQFIALEQSDMPHPRNGWSVDCSLVNFLDTHHPGLRQERDYPIICAFTAQMMMNTTAELAEAFSDNIEHADVFCPYTLSVLADIRSRGLRVLEILGFDCGILDDYMYEGLGTCRDYACVGPRKSLQNRYSIFYRVDLSHDRRGFPQRNSPEAWEPYNHQYSDEHSNLISTFEEYLNLYPWLNPSQQSTWNEHADTHNQQFAFLGWSPSLQIRIVQTIRNAAFIAAELAFTDWDSSIKSLSIDCFHRYHAIKPPKLIKERMPVEADQIGSNSDSFMTRLTSVVSLCTSSNQAALLITRFLDWAATDCDGIILINSGVSYRSIANLRGAYFQFRQGRISYEKTILPSIRVETSADQACYLNPEAVLYNTRENLRDNSNSLGPDLNTYFGQSIQSVRSRQHFTVEDDTIWLKLEYENAQSVWTHIDPIKISRAIPRLLVTTPCTHPSNTPARLHGQNPHLNHTIDVRKWISLSPLQTYLSRTRSESIKLMPDSSDLQKALLRGSKAKYFTPNQVTVFYSKVKDCEEAQWLSCLPNCQNALSDEAFRRNDPLYSFPEVIPRILQKDTCLFCTIHQLGMLLEKYRKKLAGSRYATRKICIIPCGDVTGDISSIPLCIDDFTSCQNYHSIKVNNLPDTSLATEVDHSASNILHTPCCLAGKEKPCIVCAPHICPPEDSCKDCYETLPGPRILRKVIDPQEPKVSASTVAQPSASKPNP